MKLDLIKCTVRLNEKGNFGNTEVVKAGPSALRATEIPILRFVHDVEGGFDQGTCCIANADVVGQVDVSKQEEMDRLTRIYGQRLVSAVYPGGRGTPETLYDCDLPQGTFVPQKKKTGAVEKSVPLPEEA